MKSIRLPNHKYLEQVKETNEWYYIQDTPCSEPDEVFHFKGNYEGTKLYLIHYPSGKLYQPIKQIKNVFLQEPTYHHDDKTLNILSYDFNHKQLEVISFEPNTQLTNVLIQVPFDKLGDMINIRLITTPLTLVKHEIHEHCVKWLWPEEKETQFERHEALEYREKNQYYTSKWIEDPDYHEEVLTRSYETDELLERKVGYLRRMPNGELWYS